MSATPYDLAVSRFADFQTDIYAQGAAGVVPSLPLTFDGLMAAAEEVMDPRTFGYVAGSAGTGATNAANRDAFSGFEIVPRHLRGVADRDLQVDLLAKPQPTPLLLAPIGALGTVFPNAELEVARVASALGVPMVLSTLANHPLEHVAAALHESQGGTGWFQLYWPNDNEVALSLVHRAEQAGYEALVVTLDTWTLAWRPVDLAHGYLPFLNGAGLANYLSDPVFRARLKESPEEHPEAAVALWTTMFNNPGLRARDLAWLKKNSKLPVIAKGVCHPDDARIALAAGLDGIIVSNHGGRQIDGARAALNCLADVVEASGDMPVLFDSGIRTGSDILKALALGARAVLIGRPYVFGLALGGGAGVGHVLRCLLAELDLTLGLSGHAAIAELGPESLVRAGLGSCRVGTG